MMIFFSHHGSLSVLFFLSCCLYAWRYDELSSLKTDLRQADWLLSWRRNYMEHKLTMTNKWIACEALYITSFLFGVSLFSVPFYFPSALLNISLQIFGVKCYGVIACQIMSLGLLLFVIFLNRMLSSKCIYKRSRAKADFFSTFCYFYVAEFEGYCID